MEVIFSGVSSVNLVILFFAGVVAGVCNVMAGGGSLLTIPLLIFLGLDSAGANGTNRVAIAIQNVFAVAGFRRKGFGDVRFCIFLILPALPGAVLGAVTASKIDDMLFRRILSIVMIMVLVIILSRNSGEPSKKSSSANLTRKQKILIMLAFTGIGFYAGFIQAGVGYLIIAALTSIAHLDLVRSNCYKVFVVGALTWVTIAIFMWFNHIVWGMAIVLSAGSAIGGWLGSYVAVIGGEKWIKAFLTVSVILMALKLSGLFF